VLVVGGTFVFSSERDFFDVIAQILFTTTINAIGQNCAT